MNNLKILKVINTLMFFTILIVITAISLYTILPFPSLQRNFTVLKFHYIAGITFVVLAILHFILNMNWIKSQIFGIRPKAAVKPALKPNLNHKPAQNKKSVPNKKK